MKMQNRLERVDHNFQGGASPRCRFLSLLNIWQFTVTARCSDHFYPTPLTIHFRKISLLAEEASFPKQYSKPAALSLECMETTKINTQKSTNSVLNECFSGNHKDYERYAFFGPDAAIRVARLKGCWLTSNRKKKKENLTNLAIKEN